MTDDLELDTWRADWNAVADAPPPEPLLAEVHKQANRQLRSAIGEVGASVFLVVVSVLLILRQPIAPVVGFAMAMCLYVGVWLTYFFMIRIGSWGGAGSTVREYIERSRRLHSIEVRWARFARACMIALVVFFAAWAPWLISAKWQMYRAAPWRGVVGFGIAMCIFALVFVWNRRKLRLLHAAEKAFKEQTSALIDVD